MSAAVVPADWSMRMSSGASCEYAKPRSATSSCSDETPRSNRMPSAASKPAERDGLGDSVVDGVHERDAVAEPGEPLARDAQRVLVAVEPDEVHAGEPLEERLGVSAHAERGVDEDGAVALERGRQQLDASVEQNGGMDVAQVHDLRGLGPWVLIPIRSDLAPGKCVRAGAAGSQDRGLRTGPESPPAPTRHSSLRCLRRRCSRRRRSRSRRGRPRR